MDFRAFGNRAKYARKVLNNFSLSDVERQTGINRSTVGMWEKRTDAVAKVDSDNLWSACEMYGVEFQWMLNGTGPITRAEEHQTFGETQLPVIAWTDLKKHKDGIEINKLSEIDAPSYLISGPRCAATTVASNMLVEFNAGDTIIINPDIEPKDGQYLLYELDHQITIVTYIELAGGRRHISALTENPSLQNYAADHLIAVVTGKYYN